MDKQKRFNEEVSNKVAELNSHMDKLNDILWDISDIASDGGVEFKAKDARGKLGQIVKVINEILDKLDDRE